MLVKVSTKIPIKVNRSSRNVQSVTSWIHSLKVLFGRLPFVRSGSLNPMRKCDLSVLSELRGLASTKVVNISQQFRFGKKQLAVLSSAELTGFICGLTNPVNQFWQIGKRYRNWLRWKIPGNLINDDVNGNENATNQWFDCWNKKK